MRTVITLGYRTLLVEKGRSVEYQDYSRSHSYTSWHRAPLDRLIAPFG